VHRLANVLDKLPKGLQPRAKRALHEIMYTETRAAAEREIARFGATYGAKYPKAVASLTVDQDRLLAYFDYPAEHWKHRRKCGRIAVKLARALAAALVVSSLRVLPSSLVITPRAGCSPGSSGSPGRKDDEALLRKVLVEGDGRPETLSSHEDEARAIGEAVGLVCALLEERPRGVELGGADIEHLDGGGIEEDAANRHGSTVTEPRPRKGDRLVEDVAGRHELSLVILEHGADPSMVGVGRVDIGEPRPRINVRALASRQAGRSSP
jgi:hypothetical protein